MIDKRDSQQILGCLMQKPQLLSEIDKYSFILTDFPTRFERSIFMAIDGLYRNGATRIQPIDIENFLESDPVSAKLFKDKNGIEYLQDIIELSEPDNFGFYYNRFKMFNLLKDLKKQGFDVSEFYCEDCAGCARNIMFVLEGLKICAQTIGVTPEMVDREILYLFKNLSVEE